MVETADVLVIGAGIAGLALARDLALSRRRVRVLDKSRGVSGRSSTRRLEGGAGEEARLDHGARYFTARDGRTRAWAQSGLEAGWLSEWTRRVPSWKAGQITQGSGGHPRYVPPKGMSTLGRELATGLDVELEAEVTALGREGGVWQVRCRDGRSFEAATLMLNLPPPQIIPLLKDIDIDLAPLQAVQFDPCWAVGAVLKSDIAADWPALWLEGHPALDWIAREHTKRPPGSPPALMLHAGATWTRAHLEDDRQSVIAALLDAARDIVGSIAVAHSFAHRWCYATPTVRYPQASGYFPDLQLGWCGDWCQSDAHGPRVEAALLSGWHLAGRLGAG